MHGGEGGLSSGGGGSGGIAAVYYKSSSRSFSYSLYGGSGKKIGASGFLYLMKTESEQSQLILQGRNVVDITSPSVLVCDPKQIDYNFDEIKLLKSSTFSMVTCSPGSPMTLISKKITGDKSGWLVVKGDQDVYIGVTGVMSTSMELEFNVNVEDGGTLSVPSSFVVASDTQINLAGSLVGISDLTIEKKGKLLLRYPGHTGFRQTPQQGVSLVQFSYVRIKDDGSLTTSSPNKVKLVAADLLQEDYGSILDSGIPVTVNKERVQHTTGPSLNRQDCPHGYETIELASKTLYNPCGVGRHVYKKSNESYLIFKNVSVAISVNETIYVIQNETRYNVTYYIACDYEHFVLLPGQSCTLAHGNYNYTSLEIQGGATINVEPGNRRSDVTTVTVSKLTIFSGGSIVASTSAFVNAIPASSNNGGSYGGLGGGDTSQSLYGNISQPTDYGSTGGGSGQNRGKGGGVIILKTGDLINDGLVDASGGVGSSGGGSGSGGSIHVMTDFLKGWGTFRASGANANNPAGAGGGGRIGVTVLKSQSEFRGDLDASGGSGHKAGASGTVFIRDLRQGTMYETLIVRNKVSGNPPARLPSSSSYAFDEIRVEKDGTFLSTSHALRAKWLVTDGTGKITVSNGSRVDILNLSPLSEQFACDLDIQDGGSLYFHTQPKFTGPGSPSVVVRGILSANEPTLGKGKILKITSTGQLWATSLKLLKGSSLQVEVHGTVKKGFSDMQFHLTSLRLDTNAQITFSQGNVTMKVDSLHLGQGAAIMSGANTKLLNITAINMIIDYQAKLSFNSGGYIGGPGAAHGSGNGCGHGGEGGGSQGGDSYGSVFEPQHYGSGNSARGGGIILLDVKEKFTLYGSVSVNGAEHSSGGASGGSVLLRTGTLSGHGEIVSNGGGGLSASAGGSGGRIALYVTDKSPFTGTVSAFGGCGSLCGAAGTIFIREYVVGLPLNSTIVDNGNRNTKSNTIVMHEKKVSYTMRLLKLVNGARLKVAKIVNARMKIEIQNLDGDGSGSFHVYGNQTLTLGAGKAVTARPFVFPWAMIVEEGATLNLAPVLFITRTVATPSLYLAGKLTGGQEVVVGQGASVVVAKTGTIGTFSNTPGMYSFRSLKVSSGGRIKFEVDGSAKVPVEVRSVSIDVGFGGSLEGRYLKVRTPLLNIAFNGTLTSDGLGNSAGFGTGAGSSSLLTGGGYGGCGGGITLQECRVYGSLFKATEFGSGGGTSQAQSNVHGTGGGIIDVDVSVLIHDGVISSNGGSADSSRGGGSGGSVHISVTEKINGRGSIQSIGGDGFGSSAGAGGGGRISLLLTGEDKYSGVFSARGGKSHAKGGSPGTVYIEVGRTALRKKKLHLDNINVTSASSLPVLLNESSVRSFDFHELRIFGKVTLHLEKSMQVDKLVTDSDSLVHVKDNVIFTVEPSSRYLQPYCSFHVERDGEIRIPDEVMFLGSNNVLKGTLTGILDMIIGENRRVSFASSTRTARYIDGQYTFITNRGEYRFSSLRIKNGAFLTFDNAKLKRVPFTVGKLEINFGGVLQSSWLELRASDVVIHPGAILDLSGQGHESEKGLGAGGRYQLVGTGAGHGGYGGLSTGNLGTWYGSAFNPNVSGSGGGSSTHGSGGNGGGYLHLTIVRELKLEGTIRVDATSGGATNSGGGSGGSIWISADDILGNGLLSSRGGGGNGLGGGGSGGRIGIYLQKPMSFEGVLTAEGGSGQHTGAAGTLYILDNNKRVPLKRLWIKNLKTANNKPKTVLYEAGIINYLLDELQLIGMTRFEIYNLQRLFQNIKVTNFLSDGIGEIALRENQTMLAEVRAAKESHLTLTTNIYVERGANLVMASNLTVDGATLIINGKLSNVRHLVVESGSSVQFGITSQTTLMENNRFVFQSELGTQQFASVTLKSGSDFGAPLNLKLSVGNLDLKSGVTLAGKIVEIKAKTLFIRRGATITTNSIIEDTGSDGESGQTSGNGGSGGGHGSVGGVDYNGLAGGNPYGTLYEPNQPGRPGGDGSARETGGKGGGVIRIETDFLDNDGSITANGGHASTGSRGGGGSGGSVYCSIERAFSGTGTVSANGGIGDGAGGCGSGGRISVHLKFQYAYRGVIQALGGLSSRSASSGGPGTVHIQDVRHKLSYHQLHIDNQGQNWESYITLHENKTFYHFNELHMFRKASLRISPAANIAETSTLSIVKLHGDRSGLLHLYENHKAVIEVVEAQRTTTKTPVNLRIDDGAEAVMSTTVYIVGKGAVALQCNGTLSGIRNLYITQTREVQLHRNSRTSGGNARPGTFLFSNVKLYSGSSVTMEDEIEMKIIVGFLNVKFHAKLEAHHLDVVTSSLDVETGGLVSAAGANKARQAVPSSEVSSLPRGAGAGHASNGGAGFQGAPGGSYFGSLYQPKDSGRRGGSGPSDIGGSGGGYISIEAGTLLTNDGTITSAGEDAAGAGGAGGGSGGSLLLKTDKFIGEPLHDQTPSAPVCMSGIFSPA